MRCLTIVDNHTRISSAIGVGFRYTACNIIETLNLAVKEYGQPESIRVENGPEFISKELDLWAYARGVQLDFSPGKPTDNAFIESFDNRFRQECLNQLPLSYQRLTQKQDAKQHPGREFLRMLTRQSGYCW